MSPVRRRFGTLVSVILAITLVAAACGDDDDTASAENGGGNGGELSGRVVVSGSSTVEPITALNAELFREQNPEVGISVDGPGTGDGFELFCNGETDISDASRAIQEEEVAICEENGINYTELQVAIDGLSVLTSPENDVECLSFLDLYALLGPESQGFESWSDANSLAEELAGQLDPAEFGESHAPYPDEDLVVTGPGEESGTFDSFVEIALEAIADERGQEPTTRPDYTSSPNDNVIVEGVTSSASSLGWVGFSFFVENQDNLKAIPVDGGNGCVEPTNDTIASGEYPIARPLFIYPNTDEAAQNEAVKAFVDFYLTDEGRASVSEVGYVDLEDDVWQETINTWESATG